MGASDGGEAFRYPKNDPKIIQATRVQHSDMAGYVKVWVYEKDYGVRRAGWSNPTLDKSTSDCLVEDEENGWLRIWWNDKDVEPSQTNN
ncbi:hypothetical protein ACFL0F_00235 [Patescibacteria group bacterium]